MVSLPCLIASYVLLFGLAPQILLFLHATRTPDVVAPMPENIAGGFCLTVTLLTGFLCHLDVAISRLTQAGDTPELVYASPLPDGAHRLSIMIASLADESSYS